MATRCIVEKCIASSEKLAVPDASHFIKESASKGVCQRFKHV